MNHKWLGYFLFLCTGLALPARAQLEFTNVSKASLPNLFGITCGGASNSIAGGSNYVFVAVGANSVVTWTLTNTVNNANQNSNWIQKPVSGASGLDAAAFGGNIFLVTGDNNNVFSSTDTVNWTNNGAVFANSARAMGMAFNHGDFVCVASAPEIAWSANPTTTPWGPATINGLSFADSFRGVTAFNLSSSSSTNFAACGILGRLATSSDGGRNWATPYGNIGQPNLLGITSDDRKTLVCVGANGTIITFTNGGTPWSSNSWGTDTLNAVSYVGTNYLGTNYGFISVGAAGSVWMSADGKNWANIKTINPTLNANGNNLNGVFFATSGKFKGIGVLVGDSGTIILAGTPPPSPVNPVGATNCATYPGPANNNPLSVSLVTNADYPPGFVTVDWYDASTNGNRVASGTAIYTPTNNPNMIGWNVSTNYIYYAEQRDLRTGFTSMSRTPVMLTIYPVAAPPTNDGNKTSCYNVAVPLSVSVPPGVTADWYSNLTLVASGTNVYVPPVPINLGTNLSVTNTYSVTARFVDSNLMVGCYSPPTNVSLISLSCTNVITSIAPSGTNAIIQWYGNYVLQNATNLTPPVTWIPVINGGPRKNVWTNAMVSPPPNNFFRLCAPTN